MKILTLENIINHLEEKKSLLKDKFGVIRIGVFGSFAEKKQTALSDIDMVVEIEKSKRDIHSFLQLKRFLEEEFSRNVDLGFENSLKPIIREKIREKIIYV
jgi:predicted nucleotidyltransferase